MGHVGHEISKGFKKLTHAVGDSVKGVLGIATGGALYNGTQKVKVESGANNANLVAAPAVAAPEPVVGTEEETLTGRRVKKSNKGKSSLYVGSSYTGSGGTTGTGLNL